MHNNDSAELKSDKAGNDTHNDNTAVDRESSELFIGSVTFVIFIVFMTAWMYFTG